MKVCMLNLIRKELAVIEVEDTENRQFPKGEQFLFKRVRRDRFADIPTALDYYNRLSDHQIAVCYWEYASWACFNMFMRASKKQMAKSISMLDYVKEELKLIDVFMSTGDNEIMAKQSVSIDISPRINQYSSIMFGDNNYRNNVSHDFYLSLLNGEWEDFINPDELVSYKKAFEENFDNFCECLSNNESFMGIVFNDSGLPKTNKDSPMACSEDCVTSVTNIFSDFIASHPLYKDTFNSHWNMAVTIQGMFWYRKYLEEIDYAELERLYWYDPSTKPQDDHINFAKQLERKNDGYLLMLDKRQAYLLEFETEPSWDKLMDYIGKNDEWNGEKVDVSYQGDKVKSINVEGMSQPLTRESFRARFNRYFKKPK